MLDICSGLFLVMDGVFFCMVLASCIPVVFFNPGARLRDSETVHFLAAPSRVLRDQHATACLQRFPAEMVLPVGVRSQDGTDWVFHHGVSLLECSAGDLHFLLSQLDRQLDQATAQQRADADPVSCGRI